MATSWTSLTLFSLGSTVALVQLLPEFSISSSYLKTFPVLFIASNLVAFIYNVVIYPRFFSPLRHLPGPSGNSFFTGQFRRIIDEPTGVPHVEWANNIPNDGLITYRTLMNAQRVVPTNPHMLAEVLTHRSYEFKKPSQLRNGLGKVLGVGLVLSEGEEHRLQRKAMMPAFAYRHVKDLYPIFWEKSRKLAAKLTAELEQQTQQSPEKSSVAYLELGNWVSRAALDIIGTAGLGKDFNALDDPENELNRTYRKLMSPSRSARILALMSMVIPPKIVRAIPIGQNNDIVEASDTIKRVCRKLIGDKKLKMLDEEKRTEVDILSVALESGGFTDEELVNQLMTFLLAGHETTATAMMWTIYLLCQNPEMQTRLREEVRAKLPSVDSDVPMTSSMLEPCSYLHAVCNEALRFYSPVPITIRVTTHETQLMGVRIPKNTTIVIPISAANLNVDMWGPDAGTFNPDRWTAPGKANSGGAKSNFSFMTFLHGPRSCIGQAFAKAEFACLLAAIVGRFEFELQDCMKGKFEISGGITSKPAKGLHVKMRVVEGWSNDVKHGEIPA